MARMTTYARLLGAAALTLILIDCGGRIATMKRTLATTLLALVVAGCGGNPPLASVPPTGPTTAPTITQPPTGQPPTGQPPTSSPSTDTVALYGHGPQPDPSITYQPDVVLIGGGPAAIRSVSEDGMVWTMDPTAPGAAQLVVGSVMFASARAVGRVIKLEQTAAGTAVTLAPVALGEVIAEGRITFNEEVSLDDLAVVPVGQPAEAFEDVPSDLAGPTPSPGADTSDGTITLTLPALQLAAVGAFGPGTDRAAQPPAAAAGSSSTKVGAWTVTAYRQPGKLGLKAERGLDGTSLKVILDANIEVGNLHVRADVPITRGEVGNSNFELSGITGLNISVGGGAPNGLADNRSAKIEIPIVITRPVIIGGFPAILSQKFKFLVQSAFTALNGNMTANASWTVDGPLGFDGETLTTPTLTERGPKLVDSITGVSVGVNGLVVAVSFEFGLLIGLPIAGAGPVAAFITSLGLTNGSSLGIVRCRQATITSTLTAGVGIQTLDTVRNALQKLYNITIPQQQKLFTKQILQESWYAPPVQACR